jgi:hypothetical protein
MGTELEMKSGIDADRGSSVGTTSTTTSTPTLSPNVIQQSLSNSLQNAISQQGGGGTTTGSGKLMGGNINLGSGLNLGGGAVNNPERPLPVAPEGFYGGGGGFGGGGGAAVEEEVSEEVIERTPDSLTPVLSAKRKNTEMFMWALLIGSVGYLAYGIYKKKITI